MHKFLNVFLQKFIKKLRLPSRAYAVAHFYLKCAKYLILNSVSILRVY